MQCDRGGRRKVGMTGTLSGGEGGTVGMNVVQVTEEYRKQWLEIGILKIKTIKELDLKVKGMTLRGRVDSNGGAQDPRCRVLPASSHIVIESIRNWAWSQDGGWEM